MQEDNPTELNVFIPDDFIFTDEEFNNLHISGPPRQVSTSTTVARRCSIRPVRVRTLRSRRSVRGGVRQRKVDAMSKRIHQLEAEIKILKSKNFCDRCKSKVGLEAEAAKPNACQPVPPMFMEKEPVKPIPQFLEAPTSREF